MEIKKICRTEPTPKIIPKPDDQEKEVIEIPEDVIVIEPDYPPYIDKDGYIHAYRNGRYEKTGMSLVGPEGKQGDAFTFDDFTECQLALLRGPEGKPGKDGQFSMEDYEKIKAFLKIPKCLCELQQDSKHQTVSQEEKDKWNSFATRLDELRISVAEMKQKLDETIALHMSISADTITRQAQRIYELTSSLQELQYAYEQLTQEFSEEIDPTVKTWAKIGNITVPTDAGVYDLENSDIDVIVNS